MIPPAASRRFDRSLLSAGPLAGQIVAVFAHAAVVRLNRDGVLLTLLHPSRDLVPFGVAIPWDERPPAAGDAVRLSDRELSLGASRFVLEGEGDSLELASAPFSLAALKLQVPVALRFARRNRPAAERQALKKADESLRRVVLALSSGQCPPDELADSVHRLVGTGFGSTPTGDDWLVGVVAIGHRLGDSGYLFRPAVTALCATLSRLPATATTPISREVLRHAARGNLPEALLCFAALLGDPTATAAAMRQACQRLLAVGSQTGGDFLTGALSLASGVRSQRGGIA
jgi:hypothetical protein